MERSDLQDDRHDQRAAAGAFLDKPLKVIANLLFDDSIVSLLFRTGVIERALHDLPCLGNQSLLGDCHTAHHDLGCVLEQPCPLIDGNNRQHDPVFAEVFTVADDKVSDNIVRGSAGVDADAAHGYLAGFSGGVLVQLQNIPVLQQNRLLHYSHRAGEIHVPLEVAIVAMYGDEELWSNEVNHQPQLFLAAVSTDVDQPRSTVVVDNLGIAAFQMVDNAVDGPVSYTHLRAHETGRNLVCRLLL